MLPTPSCAAAVWRPVGESWLPNAPKAVSHDLAKSVWNETLPSSKPPALVKARPLTVYVLGHGTTVFTSAFFSLMTANAVTILNVEPGGTEAVRARLSAPPLGPLATARTCPSLTRRATSADRLATPASAPSA